MKCFYCGSNCDKKYSIKEYVKKTFTNYDIVACPDSQYVCDDCVWAFGSNSEIQMIDGEIRNGSPRNYSWFITKNKKIAFTKKHIEEIKYLLFHIKKKPFKLVIADSGQKHLLFRAPWNFDKNNFILQFEEQQIIVDLKELAKRIFICNRLSAAIGKVAILNPDKVQYAIAVQKYWNDLIEYEKWLKIHMQPLSQLAVWLAKNKQEAQNEYQSVNT
ncbi:MAG: hypothetical protein PVI88_00100 [Nitrosopumilaceae archaeon]|jgi:hypothetical protein